MIEVTPRMRDAVLRRAMPPRVQRAAGLTLGVLADLCVVGLLGLSMWLIVRAGEQPPILHLTFAIVGVRALALGRAAFRYAERLASHDAALNQLSRLRADTFEALVPRVPGAIEGRRRGEVLAAFVDDVDQLQDQPLRVRQPLIVSAIVVGLSLVAVALILLPAGLALASVVLAFGALAVWLSARFSGAHDRELSGARAALSAALLDRFAAAETLAAFDAVSWQRARIDRAERDLSRVQLRRARSAGLTGGLLSLGAGAASLLLLVLLLPQLGESVSAPLFAAAVVVPAAVFEVFLQVPAALTARRVVRASAERVAELTETPLPKEIVVDPEPDGTDMLDAPRLDPMAPLIEVRGLSVTHPGASRPAVEGVTFTLNAGETLILEGDSGAGKTTLALALVRFLECEGDYRLGGTPVTSLTGQAVRRVVGLCEQAPTLFDADLRQNLKFARDTATDAELMAVLDRVGLGTWARERGGLDARVGERGALVSGGQAQRISLARAILADFPVVILDEPTAGVDRELSDRLLTELLEAVPDDRAVILISHTGPPAGVAARRLVL